MPTALSENIAPAASGRAARGILAALDPQDLAIAAWLCAHRQRLNALASNRQRQAAILGEPPGKLVEKGAVNLIVVDPHGPVPIAKGPGLQAIKGAPPCGQSSSKGSGKGRVTAAAGRQLSISEAGVPSPCSKDTPEIPILKTRPPVAGGLE